MSNHMPDSLPSYVLGHMQRCVLWHVTHHMPKPCSVYVVGTHAKLYAGPYAVTYAKLCAAACAILCAQARAGSRAGTLKKYYFTEE